VLLKLHTQPANFERAVVFLALALGLAGCGRYAPGTLPKTSSGKLQRSLCRQRYLEEALTLA